jgi:hypothetical protein
VVVPAGTHTISYTFVDSRLIFGLELAGGTIVVLIVLGVFFGRRRRLRSGVVVTDVGLDELTVGLDELTAGPTA